jgi:4-hydroxy-tetrahydrodipicolinate synthase
MIHRETRGVFAIAPTPFTTDHRVDLDSIDRLVDYYAEAGAAGLTILGQLGEAAKLDADEARLVADRYLARADIPVVVGVSCPGFASMRSLTHHVMDRGAAGVMIAPPTTLRTDEQIIRYFGQAVDAIGSDVHFVLQDYPLASSVVISPSVLTRIAVELPSCVMLKHEDWPGLDKITALRDAQAADAMPRLSILCGNGGLFLNFEIERGADGAMTGYCFTKALVAIVAAFECGDRELGHTIFDAHLPLIRYEQQPQVGLSVRKYVLAKCGVIQTDTQRMPATALTGQGIAEVEFLLKRLASKDESGVSALTGG